MADNTLQTQGRSDSEIVRDAINGIVDYAALERILRKAMGARDAVLYATVTDALGRCPEVPELYEAAGEERIGTEEDLDERCLETMIKQDSPVLDPKARLRKKDLETLQYSVLREIFYGIPNLPISCVLKDSLNPAEIIALYYAAAGMKRGNMHLGTNLDFLELVAAMNSRAYPHIGALAAVAKKKYSTAPGAQRERLAKLHPDVKESFRIGFYQPYIPSNAEEPSNPRAFIDFNSDGASKGRYIEEIMGYFR